MFSLRYKKNYLWIIFTSPTCLELCNPSLSSQIRLTRTEKVFSHVSFFPSDINIRNFHDFFYWLHDCMSQKTFWLKLGFLSIHTRRNDFSLLSFWMTYNPALVFLLQTIFTFSITLEAVYIWLKCTLALLPSLEYVPHRDLFISTIQ